MKFFCVLQGVLLLLFFSCATNEKNEFLETGFDERRKSVEAYCVAEILNGLKYTKEINNPAAERTGYVGSIRKFIVLWGLLPTYRLQRKFQPPQGARY
jgi:hypothetical protein